MPRLGMMQIGELAERTELSLRTIRFYDEAGLLTPSARSAGGFRLYTEADYERLMVIRRMKPLGFAVEEMRELLDVVDGLGLSPEPALETALRTSLDHFLVSARERRDKLRRQLEMAEEFIALLSAR